MHSKNLIYFELLEVLQFNLDRRYLSLKGELLVLQALIRSLFLFIFDF